MCLIVRSYNYTNFIVIFFIVLLKFNYFHKDKNKYKTTFYFYEKFFYIKQKVFPLFKIKERHIYNSFE